MYKKLLAGQSCHLYSEEHKKWKDIHFLIGRNGLIVDRYEKLDHNPFPTLVAEDCRFPRNWNALSKQSYEDICLARISDIFTNCIKMNKKLHLLYSGGIDSTLILVMLLRSFDIELLKNTLVICLNEKSIAENPFFYHKYIVANFKMLPSSHIFYLLNDKNVVLTGELNDPLFGNYLTLLLDLNLGQDFCLQKMSIDSIASLLTHTKMASESIHFWSNELYKAAISQNDVDLLDLYDFLWWFNFVYRWQAIYFGLILRIPEKQIRQNQFNENFIKQNIIHFYSSQDFQIWSIRNRKSNRYKKWVDYKKAAKKLIYEFDKNSEYFLNKTKAASLNYLLIAKPVAKSIDQDYCFRY